MWFVKLVPSVHFSPTPPPPNKSPSNLSRFVATKDPQSGFDELVNPGPQSAVRAGSMMAESLKGWSDGFIGQESKREGQTVRGLVIGLIYPHSPRVSSSSAHRRHRSRSVPLFEEQKTCLWCLCLCGRRLDGPIITLTSRHFPPVTHLNEAPMETYYVCRYLIRCGFLLFSLSLVLCLSPPASVVHNLISDL